MSSDGAGDLAHGRFVPVGEHKAIDADRAAADLDQGAADGDQTASDCDQTAAERDEADAASDQRAAERDQESADRQPRAKSVKAAQAYEASRSVREASKMSRLATHLARARTTHSRAQTAVDRDVSAATRDEAARLRDTRTVAFDRFMAASDAPLADQLAQIRASSAAARLRAAGDRERAARDRAGAAAERRRLEAELSSAHLDDLTGAFGREVGRSALTHEIDRARSEDHRFVLAFVNVDGMRLVNDRDGHAAGDLVLQRLVASIRSNLRPFDPVVRYGDDSFLCGLSDVDLDDVGRRFDAVTWSLRAELGVGISMGLVALEGGETLDELISRAAADLRQARTRTRELQRT